MYVCFCYGNFAGRPIFWKGVFQRFINIQECITFILHVIGKQNFSMQCLALFCRSQWIQGNPTGDHILFFLVVNKCSMNTVYLY